MGASKDGEDEPPAPGRNGEKDFKSEKRSNATHASATDPDARLYRKGNRQPAERCYIGHALMENRNGLMVGGVATRATGDAEPLAALELVKAIEGRRRVRLGADKAYDTANFVLECREENVTPHVAQNITSTRGSRIDGRTTRHAGYAVSLRLRKRIEEGFGWTKEVAGLAQVSCAASPASTSPSCSASPPTISCGCRSSSPRPRHEPADGVPGDRPLAHRRGRSLGPRSSRHLRPGVARQRRGWARRDCLRALGASLDLAYAHDDVAFDWRATTTCKRSGGRGLPNSSRTARWRSSSNTTAATTPS